MPTHHFFEKQGQNLILNMNDHGFTVCAYNRTTAKVDSFLENEAKGKNDFAKKNEAVF
jgi:6-phosphogluconate dehydrogenase